MKMRFDGPNTNKNLGTEERKATEANSQMCSGGVVWSPTLKEEGTLSDFRLFQATEPLISTSENYFVATPAARRGVSWRNGRAGTCYLVGGMAELTPQ
jgi:hypothetical protein